MKKLGLYIHVPFCKKKCNYCDFYSTCNFDAQKTDEYVAALCSHIKKDAPVYENYVFDTVYLGGGTPSILTPSQLDTLFKQIRQSLNVSSNAEITLEANPDTLDKERLIAYRKIGINRLSIGLQSASDGMLKVLGRLHSLDRFYECYMTAKESGFENISVDVMYGLPNQKTEDFIKTLDYVVKINPSHISSYCLKVEKETPFGRMKDSLSLPSDEEEYEMYMAMCNFLKEKGYEHYEISNFALSGFRSRHNIKYWQLDGYVGLGPNAHSYFEGERYYYYPCVDRYISQCNSSTPTRIFENEEEKSAKESSKIDQMDEYVMLKLRLCDGVDTNEFQATFDSDFYTEYPRVREFIKSGHMRDENGRCFFTPQGFFVSNYIYTEILHF